MKKLLTYLLTYDVGSWLVAGCHKSGL